MKKVLLPLLILMAISMLLAVESAPSAIVGYVKYPCVEGLDFIATPMNSTITSCADLETAYPSMLDQISYWDPSIQSWFTAVNMYDGTFEGDFTVTNGMPLMVYSVGAFDLYNMGGLPSASPSYTMVDGLNALMIPLNRSDVNTCALLANEATSLDQVSYWDPAIQSWFTAVNMYDGTFEGDFTLSLGMPLMVYNVGDFTWPTAAPAGRMSAAKSK